MKQMYTYNQLVQTNGARNWTKQLVIEIKNPRDACLEYKKC